MHIKRYLVMPCLHKTTQLPSFLRASRGKTLRFASIFKAFDGDSETENAQFHLEFIGPPVSLASSEHTTGIGKRVAGAPETCS